ncbi:MAG: UDP-N-acetylmuramoyl-L-alanine--D-glutamate ligase [bacterium]|nr:UDP-N-acetylmuramoyl-L-alanine--D-glutamate ligase [bacterium]
MVKDKRFSVIGFGRSGQAISKLLTAKQGIVFVSDSKPMSKEQMKIIADYHLRYETSHSEDILDADYIILSPGVPDTIEMVTRAAWKRIPVLSEIEIASRLMKNRFVCVTGTNGKSTTAYLTYQILRMLGVDCDLGGNISPGKSLSEIAINEPDKNRIIVLELSSFQLEHIVKFTPYIGMITNISDDHLDRYKSIDDYLNAKMQLFKNMKDEGYRILNKDDSSLSRIEPASNTLYVSENEVTRGAFLRGKEIIVRFNDKEMAYDVSRFPLIGKHNLYNLMFALLSAVAVHKHSPSLSDRFGEIKGLEHRMEFVAEINNVKIYNNSMCTNPKAFVASLESCGFNQTVILGGRNKNFDTDMIIKAVIKYAKRAFIIGEVRESIKELLDSEGYSNHATASTLEEAVENALKSAESGTTINFSPGFSSFDMFKDFIDRGNKFKEIVKKHV